MSQPNVAKHLQQGERTVRRLLKRYGIARRSTAGTDNPNYRHGMTIGRTAYQKMRQRRCNRCRGTTCLGVHHKNDDHYDNRPENLETLCNSCHMSETKRKWWAAKKAGLQLPKSNAPTGWTRK